MATTFTIGFSSHRPETLPLAERVMAEHDHIVIEEPPTPEFSRMLAGTLPVDDYVMTADYEFPAFAAAACRMLQRLKNDGKRIHPCEPFMTHLIRIHDLFTEGRRPEQLMTDNMLWPVYQAEREATGRLLAFYTDAAAGDFDPMVESACAFAAADAARFALRDRLRAHAMVSLLKSRPGNVYVEAGYLHLRLLRELRRLLSTATTIRPVYLLREVYEAAGQRSHLYNPGDLLTLAFIFDRPPSIARQRLLAARSLIYNHLVPMEEMAATGDAFPDAREDIRVIQVVGQLSFDDCRRLHARFRNVDTMAARGGWWIFRCRRDSDRRHQGSPVGSKKTLACGHVVR